MNYSIRDLMGLSDFAALKNRHEASAGFSRERDDILKPGMKSQVRPNENCESRSDGISVH